MSFDSHSNLDPTPPFISIYPVDTVISVIDIWTTQTTSKSAHHVAIQARDTSKRQCRPCPRRRRRWCLVHGPDVCHPLPSYSRAPSNPSITSPTNQLRNNSYPLITLSTRAQVESKRADTSFLSAIQKIVAREGISGLYSGLSSALFGISVTNFVYYYWYEWTRAFFEAAAVKAGRASKKLTTVESMIAGAIAGSATVILTNPIWVVNTRMTTRKTDSEADALPGGAAKPAKKPSTLGTLAALLKNEGPQALFSGVVPALILVINPILQYTLFEQMKNTVEKKRRITPTIAFCLGALGKLFATSVTYPYITVKSQMHVASSKGSDKKEGMRESMNRVIREEGYAGLYKGMFCSILISLMKIAVADMVIDRYWTQGITERHHRGVLVCLQGRSVRADRSSKKRCCEEGRCCVDGWWPYRGIVKVTPDTCTTHEYVRRRENDLKHQT